MILHLADDEKFIDAALEQFEAVCPNGNKLIVGKNDNDVELKHVKTKNNIHIHKYNSPGYADAVGNLNEYNFIVIHSLDMNKAKVISAARDKVKILWLIWGGGDVIGPLRFGIKNYMDSKTIKLFFKIYSNNHLMYFLKRIYHTTSAGELLKYVTKGSDTDNVFFNTVIKNIKYCSTVVPGEYDIYRRHSPNFLAKYLPFNYSYIEKMTENMLINTQGNNILVGNSGHYSLNHLSVLEQLKDYSGNRKIVVPLSYGDKTYIQELVRIGHDLFGDNFLPLLNFLPATEYNKIISSCNIAIFNSTIQQAMGNIVLAIYFGLSVYLNKKNPICSFLDELGIRYFDAVEDLQYEINILPQNILDKNKRLISEHYNKVNVFKRAQYTIDYILNA